MEPFTVSTTISRPREEVFEYLADIANHAEFSDHYLTSWHLLREETYGVGAGARFRVKAPLNRFSWADRTIAELGRPYRIVEHGRGGKFNRVRMLGIWTLSPGAGGTVTAAWLRSDGTLSAPNTVTVAPGVVSLSLTDTWQIPRPKASPWEQLSITSPNQFTSAQAIIAFSC